MYSFSIRTNHQAFFYGITNWLDISINPIAELSTLFEVQSKAALCV